MESKTYTEQDLLCSNDIENDIEATTNTMKPAVIFDGYNVYTVNGCMTVPANTYNTLAQINDSVRVNSSKILNKLNYKVVERSIYNAMMSNVYTVADNFIATLFNIYSVFTCRLQSIGIEITVDPSILRHGNFEEVISIFLESDANSRADILNNALMNYAVSYINIIGTEIYNAARAKISTALSSKTPEKYSDIVSYVDKFFAYMMADMIHECSMFVTNMINMSSHLLEATRAKN